mgnify:CR=1 FL=1
MSKNDYAFNWLSNSKEENVMSNELVFVENNQVLTDSRKVAEYFEKRHDNVMRDIRGIIAQIEEEVLGIQRLPEPQESINLNDDKPE